jgi:chromosomal replication initiator protein
MTIAILDIAKVCADHAGISLDEIRGHDRARIFAWPRQDAMYLARKHTRMSLPQIGHWFSRRDHTTVMHAVKAVEARAARQEDYRAYLDEVVAVLQNRRAEFVRHHSVNPEFKSCRGRE